MCHQVVPPSRPEAISTQQDRLINHGTWGECLRVQSRQLCPGQTAQPPGGPRTDPGWQHSATFRASQEAASTARIPQWTGKKSQAADRSHTCVPPGMRACNPAAQPQPPRHANHATPTHAITFTASPCTARCLPSLQAAIVQLPHYPPGHPCMRPAAQPVGRLLC